MVEEQIHPQTYGDHEDLRELLLSNKEEGLTLTVQVDGKASFSLSHSMSEVDRRRQRPVEISTHWYDLVRKPQVFAISTIGSADWATTVAKETCPAEI